MSRCFPRRCCRRFPWRSAWSPSCSSSCTCCRAVRVGSCWGRARRPLEELRRELHLDRPVLVQYGETLGLPGDLGVSFRSREPVMREIARRFPATLLLAATFVLVAVAVALPLGILAAMRRGKAADISAASRRCCRSPSPTSCSWPLLVLVFSVQLGILPVSGYGTARHLVLPAATLGTGMAALLMRMIRATLLEELNREYVTAASARGLSRRPR